MDTRLDAYLQLVLLFPLQHFPAFPSLWIPIYLLTFVSKPLGVVAHIWSCCACCGWGVLDANVCRCIWWQQWIAEWWHFSVDNLWRMETPSPSISVLTDSSVISLCAWHSPCPTWNKIRCTFNYSFPITYCRVHIKWLQKYIQIMKNLNQLILSFLTYLASVTRIVFLIVINRTYIRELNNHPFWFFFPPKLPQKVTKPRNTQE